MPQANNIAQAKTMGPHKAQLLDAGKVAATIEGLAADILKRYPAGTDVGLIGVRTRGEYLSRRIAAILTAGRGSAVKLGTVDVTFHRDDFRTRLPSPQVGPTRIPFGVDDLPLVLIDDVLYTGRTIRAAINSIMDFGRPASIELAVLVDRGGRELPIQADYLGLSHPAAPNEHIHVHLQEVDQIDEVLLLEYDG